MGTRICVYNMHDVLHRVREVEHMMEHTDVMKKSAVVSMAGRATGVKVSGDHSRTVEPLVRLTISIELDVRRHSYSSLFSILFFFDGADATILLF